MEARRTLAMILVLCLTGSAMAVQQQQLYRMDGDGDPIDPWAEGSPVIQQHSTYVELISEGSEDAKNVTPFAAVVGVVKRCTQVNNVFDNAVLWFNDQFLFGQKRSFVNDSVVHGEVISRHPESNISQENQTDPNRNNSTAEYDAANGTWEITYEGDGPNEGGNPDRDGYMNDGSGERRYGGCFTPNGYVHAVEAGENTRPSLLAEQEINSTANDCDGSHPDNDPEDCAFTYNGTHFITDPNNHRWMIDRYLWGEDNERVMYTGHIQVDPWSPHKLGFPDEAIWAYDEDGRLRAGMPYNEDPNSPCHDDVTLGGEQRYAGSREKADTYEYDKLDRENGTADNTDPNSAQGDDWAHYRRGPVASHVECSVEYNFLLAVDMLRFNIAQDARSHPGSGYSSMGDSHGHNPYACYRDPPREYGVTINEVEQNPQGVQAGNEFVELFNPHTDRPINVTGWKLIARGPNTYDSQNGLQENQTIIELDGTVPAEGYRVIQPPADDPWIPDRGMSMTLKDHQGAIVDASPEQDDEKNDAGSWQRTPDNGASWTFAPSTKGQTNGGGEPITAGQACSRGPDHEHDQVVLDVFFHKEAPWFTETHPYWDNPDGDCEAIPRISHYNQSKYEAPCMVETHGTPPIVNDECTDTVDPTDPRRDAILVRVQRMEAIGAWGHDLFGPVCDVDAVDGYHLHDGSQHAPPNSLRTGPGSS